MNKDVHNHTAASQDASAVGRSSAGGGIGAPPSNTAPSKDIGESQAAIEVLHQGIDSLYLSFPGTLSEQKELVLSSLKANAKDVDSLTACQCIYTSGGISLTVRDRGVGRFPFSLFNDRYNLRISSSRAKQLPLASIQVKSWYLMSRGVADLMEELSALMQSLGQVDDDGHISRADLCVDFVSPYDLFSLPREAWVGRAKNAHQYWSGDQCTGWVIGQGGPLSCRLYDKTTEIELTDKQYMHHVWADHGWLGELPVYRLEFQFKREVLRSLGLVIADDLPANAGKLWRYAMQWLRLCQPNPNDSKHSRWPTHPVWEALARLEWYDDDLGAISRLKPQHNRNEDWAIKNFRASLVNMMAHRRLTSPYEAIDTLFDLCLQTCEKEARFGEKHPLNVLEDRARKKASTWGRPYADAIRESKKIDTAYAASAYRKRK